MKLELVRLAMTVKRAVLILAATMIVVACAQEPDLDLNVVDKTRPSFSFSGRSLALSFEISELPRSKPLSKAYGLDGEKIWKISAASGIKAAQWPGVSYGDVPNGLSQTIPEHGPPPKLVQDKLYVARIVGDRDDKTAMYFEIRNGSVVNVTDKVFGP